MTAKPQPMAGQTDAADDLIAELAKLMAQDAKGTGPAEASPQPFPVRIPGGDNAPGPAPVPRFDFDRTSALAGERNAPGATPVSSAPAPEEAPVPFRFDFDQGKPRPAPAAPAGAEAGPVAPAMAAVSTVEHDSIADLIAAELSADLEPAPQPASPAPNAPVATAPADRDPVSTPVADAGREERSEPSFLRAFNPQPASRPEPDRFKVPPVFGLGTASAPVADSARAPAEPAPDARQAPSSATADPVRQSDDGLGRDPIDEIEDLIGHAMRVELDKPAAPAVPERPVPSPALRSLATPTAPTFSPDTVQPETHQPAAPRALSGADEAILAAAQATGAEIGWVEAPEVQEANAAAPASRRSRRPIGMTRAVAGPLVAVTLLLAAGFGLYWVLGSGQEPGPAPLLTADTSPVKEVPAVQPDAGAPQSIVFNEINGVVPGAEEQLVSRDQADVSEVAQVPPPADVSEEGLANRKVRTVTVRPDGTIVSGEDSLAGSTILPVDRPNVPEVPGAETASPELLASTASDGATTTTAPAGPAAETAVPEPSSTEPVAPEPTTAADVTPVTPGSIVPAVDAAGNPLPGKSAPVPMQLPPDLPRTAAAIGPVDVPAAAAATGNLLPPPPAASAFGATPTQQQSAPQAPAAAIPGAVEVDALPNSAPAYAQLASLRTEEEARQAAQNLVTRFGPLFGGANMEVQRVDLGARGIYYRVRVPADSTQAANNICTNVRAAGGDCVLM